MEIKAFKALRFDEDVAGDVGSCVSPPYDVISAQAQEQLYGKSEYNIVRIIKGKTNPTDSPADNQYTRAVQTFSEWIEKGVLKPDTSKNIYGYVQDFAVGLANFQRSGFVALGKLQEFGRGVRPHEKTLDGPKADRLNLMRATAGQFGQIFVLYDDNKKIADEIIKKRMQQRPLTDFLDTDQVRHRLYAINQPADIEAVRKMMADKSIIIADGHHRYETALNYYKETANPAAQWRMMTFVNTQNPGLIILPTHRLIKNVKNFDIKNLIAQLRENFQITELLFSSTDDEDAVRQQMLAQLKVQSEQGSNAFGLYAGGGAFYVAVLKDKGPMDAAEPNKSRSTRQLDVAVLHKLVLEKILGINEKQQAGDGNIEYVKDVPIKGAAGSSAIDELIARVEAGDGQLAFFMNATKIEQVQAVAAAGERMPQKSTFFYPKIFTGLTVHKL